MAFTDKNQFGTGSREDRAAPLPSDPLDGEIEELETDSSEAEFADDDEFAELSEEEMRPFTLAEWQQSIPDYTSEELEEKLPKRTRESWMAPVMSCLFGTLLGAAIAGVLVNDLPKPQQARAFFTFFLVLALLFSCIWHWLFYLRPKYLAKKMEEQETNLAGAEPILLNEELQQTNPAGSGPIHPK
jgi:hypothetical protein